MTDLPGRARRRIHDAVIVAIAVAFLALGMSRAQGPENQHLTEAEMCQLARDHGNGVPPALLAAQAYEESGWQTNPTNGPNSAGAVGVLQIIQRFHPSDDLYDPATNVYVGSHVLIGDFYYVNHTRAGLTKDTPASEYQWDNPTYLTRALWAYVMGAGNVDYYDKHLDKHPPAEVLGYADNIRKLFDDEEYCQEAA